VIARNDAQPVRDREAARQVVRLEHQLGFEPNDLDAESCALMITDSGRFIEDLAQDAHRADVFGDKFLDREIGISIVDEDVDISGRISIAGRICAAQSAAQHLHADPLRLLWWAVLWSGAGGL